jgi:hypothetical protein
VTVFCLAANAQTSQPTQCQYLPDCAVFTASQPNPDYEAYTGPVADPLSAYTGFGCYSPSAQYYTQPLYVGAYVYWSCSDGQVSGIAQTGAVIGGANGYGQESMFTLWGNYIWSLGPVWNYVMCSGQFSGANLLDQGPELLLA